MLESAIDIQDIQTPSIRNCSQWSL